MSSRTCLLDMDGVLADFVTGVQRLRGEDSHPVLEWDFVHSREWPLMDRDFWRNLPVMPNAQSIVATCVETFGLDRVAVLSSPIRTYGCVDGKREWLDAHFPELAPRALFGTGKDVLASHLTVLIDDNEDNVRKFHYAGGNAILCPASYNRAAKQPLFETLRQIQVFHPVR